jgi:hypothetical protein
MLTRLIIHPATNRRRATNQMRQQTPPRQHFRRGNAHAVPLVAPSIPITLKMPANVVRDVRAYSLVSGLTISEIVSRAITAFLTAVRGHG